MNYQRAVAFFFTLWISFLVPHISQAQSMRLLAFGDSLTAGYGLVENEGFASVLESRLQKKGLDITVINAGVSGDTTSAGLARLDWALGEKVDGVILELGANDALRGIPVEETRQNLSVILERLDKKKIPVLVAGMRSPKNMDDIYQKAFDDIYPSLAKQYESLLFPFFLEGVAFQPELNQKDGIHPNAKGVDIIVTRIIPYVEKLIDRITESSLN